MASKKKASRVTRASQRAKPANEAPTRKSRVAPPREATKKIFPKPNEHGVYSEKGATKLEFRCNGLVATIHLLEIGAGTWAAGYDFRRGNSGASSGGISVRDSAGDEHPAGGVVAELVLPLAERLPDEGIAPSAIAAFLDWCHGFLAVPNAAGEAHAARIAALRKKIGDPAGRAKHEATKPWLLDAAPETPIDRAGLAAPGRLEHVPVARIHFSALQPRRTPPEDAKRREFEESIATAGILQPVLLRPHPKLAGQYELVAGEQRIRAARAAIKAKRQPATMKAPALIKTLDDRNALLAALAENLGRADMHPLDEARAFAAAQDQGSTAAEIAAATGANARLVQKRIKVWRDLPDDGKQALAKGTIGFAQAHAVAQIPDPRLRASVLNEVLGPNGQGGGNWKNEDWIARRWKSLQHSREQAKKDRERGAGKNGTSAASSGEANKRSHQRQIEYPKPNAAGIYDWPAKRRGGEVYSETDHQDDGEVVSIGVRVVAIRKGGRDWDHVHVAGYVIKVKGWPPLEEPLTEKTGAGATWEVIGAAEDRATDALLATPPKAADPHARAWLRDVARIVGEIDNDPKRRAALNAKLDAIQAALFPAPSVAPSREAANEAASPAPEPRAALSVAKPDVSPPLTEKLVIPPPAAEKNDAGDLAGLRLVGRHDHERTRNTSARLAGVPDFVFVEKNGRVFSYGFIAERTGGAPSREATKTAAAKKPAKAVAAAHAAAAPKAPLTGEAKGFSTRPPLAAGAE